MCVISRYGSIVPAPATPHTAPIVPEFSAFLGGLGVRGFYISMRAWRERVNCKLFLLLVCCQVTLKIIIFSGTAAMGKTSEHLPFTVHLYLPPMNVVKISQ